MGKQFVVVAYDISDDRRRTRLHNVLLDFGTPVQYSVFECLLDEKNLAQMRKAVNRTIKPRTDQVRFYYLCADCVRRAETTSGVDVVSEGPASLIV